MTGQTKVEPRRVTVQDAMVQLECARSTIYDYIKRGELVRLNRRPADHGKTMLDGDSIDALRSRCFASDRCPYCGAVA